MLKLAYLNPTGDRVLVQVDKPRETTESGLYLPQSTREDGTLGLVLAVGPGKVTERGFTIPPRVKAGDRVLFNRFHGTRIPGHDDALLLLESDIIAVIDEGEEL